MSLNQVLHSGVVTRPVALREVIAGVVTPSVQLIISVSSWWLITIRFKSSSCDYSHTHARTNTHTKREKKGWGGREIQGEKEGGDRKL